MKGQRNKATMKKTQKPVNVPTVTPDVPVDPFASTHSAESKYVDVTRIPDKALLVVDGKSYELARSVPAGQAGQYVEWVEGGRFIGKLLHKDARVTVRLPLPPPPPPREEQSFGEALRSGYYTTKLPYGERNSPERAAYIEDQQRLDAEFRRDLECDFCNDKLPQKVRDAIFGYAYEEGHSGGKSEVACEYSTFHDIALLAYEAGQQNPSRS